MRLVKVGVHGYKRFVQPSTMDMDSQVIAIVGPNEAGKTSFLDALRSLNSDDPFKPGELSRRTAIPDDQAIVWALYLLEDEDLTAISDLCVASTPRWLEVRKLKGGDLSVVFTPPLRRDLGPRKSVRRLLHKALNSPWLRMQDHAEQSYETDEASESDGTGTDVPPPLSLREQIITTIELLESHAETFTVAMVRQLRSLAVALQEAHDVGSEPQYVQSLPRAITDLAEHEGALHPDRQARARLMGRRASFVEFDEEARDLRAAYDLADEDMDEPREALANLAWMAKLSLAELSRAMVDDPDEATSLIAQANATLKDVFAVGWSQSRVAPYLERDGTMLNIKVGTVDDGYLAIERRSAGLRQFLALAAFASRRFGAAAGVLLVDEAETHLHYEAQANLVRIFEEQAIARAVIYTTHSVGCLPDDLGSSIRVIDPLVGVVEQSRIRNEFWQDEAAGLSPLLASMGARSLVFAAVRRAVFVEGIADCILLPVLLRCATRRSHLGFQVIPGLAVMSTADVDGLSGEAGRGLYLLDGDQGGRDTKARVLAKAGIDSGYVRLLVEDEKALEIEDLIHRETYLAAVNEELRRSHGEHYQISLSSLGRRLVSSSVRRWCKKQGINPPGKRNVARRVVELARDGQICCAPERKALLQVLDVDIRETLKIRSEYFD